MTAAAITSPLHPPKSQNHTRAASDPTRVGAAHHQWQALCKRDKKQAYAVTGCGVLGIVRVDLEPDKAKERFKCALNPPNLKPYNIDPSI